ncbi:MAG: 2,3-bisphosphoglycerate-independent phosphoglycerate mutase [Chloroflexi bacterium]|nr:2,3-bisphosphoglycerate-independent phosphoglycerate mutase [Chloroflexota bacterium]
MAPSAVLSAQRPRPLVLVVLDGFGIGAPEPPGSLPRDAIAAASMPGWRSLLDGWPHAQLQASEGAVGLPPGQMGNSEVGHLNLGSGRPVLQDLPRIDAAIADGSFARTPALLHAVERAARPGSRLHLICLVGPGGVHSVDRHAVELARLAASQGARDVVVHALLDGRDTPPRSADAFVLDFERRLGDVHPEVRIATVGGRYFAMDRDRRWERTHQAYEAIVHGLGLPASGALDAVIRGYARGENDEFIQPSVVDGIDGTVRDGDAVIHLNFRADRARQLVHALVDGEDFTGFVRGRHARDLLVVTLTEYEAGLPVEVAFPPQDVPSLAATFSRRGWRQFHVAETEKYAHVTYFFNGGVEPAWPGEDRLLVPSPRIATYDLRPEMSAGAITDALVGAIDGGRYDFIVANYANADMVGHTGVWDATVRALEYLDGCMNRVVEAVLAVDERDRALGGAGALLAITADHGNADEKRLPTGEPITAHSLNPVPFVLVGSAARGLRLRNGVLADVAPTLLELTREEPFEGITGRSLVARPSPGEAAAM